MRRLARKGVVVTLALLGALGLLVGAFRPWVTGAVDDAVLGATRISATGAEVAPGLSAVALAVAAAAIAVVAAGRVTRVVALVGYAVCLATAVGLGLPALVREGMSWSDVRLRAISAAPVRLQPASRVKVAARKEGVGEGAAS